MSDNDIFSNKKLLEIFSDIVKKAQVAAPIGGPSPLEIAKHMVLQLGQELNGMPNLSFETGAAKSPSTQDLKNIESFVQYLAANKVTIDGVRLAYSPDESSLALQDPTKSKDYGSIGTKVGDEETGGAKFQETGQWGEADYRVYLPGLYEYIKYLQRKATTESNKVLEVMVGKLITFVNNRFGANIPKKPKHTPGQTPSEMPADTILDSFTTGFVFNPNYKTYAPGDVSLTAGDLSSIGNLNSWMSKNKFKVATPTEASSKEGMVWQPLEFGDPKANFCNVGKVLLWRAKYLRQRGSDEDRKKADFYLKKLSEVIPQWTDPSGKPCTLDEEAAKTVTPTGEKASPTTGATPLALSQLLQLLPFHQNNIDLQRMNRFNSAYLSITAGDHKTDLQQLINSVNSKMKDVMAYSASGNVKLFPLTVGVGAAEEYASSYVKAPPGANFVRLITELKTLITEEKKLVLDLLNRYGGGGAGGVAVSQARYTPEQAAQISGDIEIANDNLQRLSAILSEWTSLPSMQTGPK